jgi:hypothetical protein
MQRYTTLDTLFRQLAIWQTPPGGGTLVLCTMLIFPCDSSLVLSDETRTNDSDSSSEDTSTLMMMIKMEADSRTFFYCVPTTTSLLARCDGLILLFCVESYSFFVSGKRLNPQNLVNVVVDTKKRAPHAKRLRHSQCSRSLEKKEDFLRICRRDWQLSFCSPHAPRSKL